MACYDPRARHMVYDEINQLVSLADGYFVRYEDTNPYVIICMGWSLLVWYLDSSMTVNREGNCGILAERPTFRSYNVLWDFLWNQSQRNY
jgi:hypothetical protein